MKRQKNKTRLPERYYLLYDLFKNDGWFYFNELMTVGESALNEKLIEETDEGEKSRLQGGIKAIRLLRKKVAAVINAVENRGKTVMKEEEIEF